MPDKRGTVQYSELLSFFNNKNSTKNLILQIDKDIFTAKTKCVRKG